MSLILVLFLAGILLLAADIFVSSFVLAVCGGVAMLAGCAVAYRDHGGVAAAWATVGAFALLGAAVYLELVVLPRTRLGRGLVVQSTSGDAHPPAVAAADVVGKPAQALTTLAPSGYVLVEGRRYEAFSQSGHAAAGAALRVVGLDNFRLIVSRP